jgi:hypothetical protein
MRQTNVQFDRRQKFQFEANRRVGKVNRDSAERAGSNATLLRAVAAKPAETGRPECRPSSS